MSATLALLCDFYSERLAEMLRHQAHAQQIGQYDANNTYQYIINREDVQLSWLSQAITDLGGTPPEATETSRSTPPAVRAAARSLIEEDRRSAQAFVERWHPRVAAMADARSQRMLDVILGETLEHERFFEQALAGRTDLLGRRASVAGPAQGEVLPGRWIE